MQKDVIYIDVDDDITAIIDKVKSASHKVVALVPPKRTGAIQSVVNLKLVQRAAEQADKRLVVITHNQALSALAGSVGIPIAKNLQSKPELAEIPALSVDDDDDIIDGGDLPIGDHAEVAEKSVASHAPAVGAAAVEATAKEKAKKPSIRDRDARKTKIPNFDSFRKKLFAGIGAGILLILFLIWAIFIAPSAKIIITANASDLSLNSQVTLGSSKETDLEKGTIKSETKSLTKDVSIDFTATGKKNVGQKATGTVEYSQQSLGERTIPAGTELTSSGGQVFITDNDVTIPASTIGPGCFPTACPGTASGTVTAAEGGTEYNGATGSVSGEPSGVSGSFDGSTSGGTDKTATVVTKDDVSKASNGVGSSEDGDAAKADLTKEFGDDFIVLTDSLVTDTSDVKPSPAVGAVTESGKATLEGSVTYTLTAVAKSEIGSYLDAYFKQQIDGSNNQAIYDNGVSDVSFTNIDKVSDSTFSANISANGKIGPKIDEATLKEYAKGKRFGDIQSYVSQNEGVDNVDVKFSPFWVNTAPNDVKKIHIEFKVNGS